MADNASFDITTGCDLQEVDNAINQAQKELSQRYDFKGITFTIELRRNENMIVLTAPESNKLASVWDVLQSKLARRGVPLNNLKAQTPKAAAGASLRQEITLTQGIDIEVAKAIVKFIKDQKLKKVQAQIQKEQVRVMGPSRDDLQAAMGQLRGHDFGISLTFGNYR